MAQLNEPLSNKRKDITGQKFGNLTAIIYTHSDQSRHSMWDFLCTCGDTYNERMNTVTGRHSSGKFNACPKCITAHADAQGGLQAQERALPKPPLDLKLKSGVRPQQKPKVKKVKTKPFVKKASELEPTVFNKHHGTPPADAVYIGRGSPYGNPFVIGKDGNRDEVCDRFEKEILPDLDLTPLYGKDLVCFCSPQRCHGDAILAEAKRRQTQGEEEDKAQKPDPYKDKFYAQELIEKMYDKGQILDILKEEFASVSDDPFENEALCQIYLHKYADAETMVGILSPKHGTPQEVADKLLAMVDEDFMDLDELGRFSVIWEPEEDTEARLSKLQYPLPMIVKPNKLRKNTDTGYMTISKCAVLSGADHRYETKDLCLDHLNRMNSVGLATDWGVVESPEAVFVRPKQKEDETSKEYQKRVQADQKFYDMSIDVLEKLDSITNTFYLTHRYDFRGRSYASGYHCNTQGDALHKAVLQFATKEKITDSKSS